MASTKSFYVMLKENEDLPIKKQVKEIMNFLENAKINLRVKDYKVSYADNHTYESVKSHLLMEANSHPYVVNKENKAILNHLEKTSLYDLIVEAINAIVDERVRIIFIRRFIKKQNVTKIVSEMDISQYSYYSDINFAMEQFLDSIRKRIL